MNLKVGELLHDQLCKGSLSLNLWADEDSQIYFAEASDYVSVPPVHAKTIQRALEMLFEDLQDDLAQAARESTDMTTEQEKEVNR